MNKQGSLIVITGPDGCGKKTQTKKLVERLKQEGCSVNTVDFPQYKKNFFGKMVGRYLKGEFGEVAKINPYLASVLYAGDRWESMEQIKEWLMFGETVVCDRYIGDNCLHQGSKISHASEREEFFNWLEDLEFNVFGAWRADITFYLDVSLEVSLELLKNKDAKEKKSYIGEKEEDGHENETHLRGVRKIANELIQRYGWIKIDCMKNGKIISPEEIHEIIWEKLNSKPRLF